MTDLIRSFEGHSDGVTALCVLGDGTFLSGSWDNKILQWDIKSGICIRIFKGHVAGVTSLCALDDGTFLSGSKDASIRQWDFKTGSCLKTFEGHSGVVRALCALDDGSFLSASEDDETICQWETSLSKTKAEVKQRKALLMEELKEFALLPPSGSFRGGPIYREGEREWKMQFK